MKQFLKIAIGVLAVLEGYLVFVLIPPTWLRPFLPYKNLGGTHPSLDWEIEQALKNHPTIAVLYYSFVGILVLLNTVAIGTLWKKLGRTNPKC